MRLQFRARPWDLVLLLTYDAIVTVVLLWSGTGSLTALFATLFVPGYLFVAALFPRDGRISWTERVLLSLGLSIVIVPLVGLFLNLTPWGVRFIPIVTALAAFSALAGMAALLRRKWVPELERLSLQIVLRRPDWAKYSLSEKFATTLLIASVVVAGTSFAYAIIMPRSGQPFTEFYYLNANGEAANLPSRLNISQEAELIIGLSNHEHATLSYTIRVDLLGVQVVRDSTSGQDETIELNRTTLSWFNVTLADKQNWSVRYRFSIAFVGLWQMRLHLYKDGLLGNEQLQLLIMVGRP